MALPLGLVGLTWLRLYLPLAKPTCRRARQHPAAVTSGFRRRGFQALLGGLLSPLDLRVGASFSGTAATALQAGAARRLRHHHRDAGALHDLPGQQPPDPARHQDAQLPHRGTA